MTEESLPPNPPSIPPPLSAEEELKECKEKQLRLLAEMENTRKRLVKEKQEMIRFATDNVVAEFLKPLDNLENALQFTEQASDEVRNWAMGFQMILTQFKDALAEVGVTSFSSQGELFDPHRHDAVEIEEREEIAEGTIIQEYTKGYRSETRTIRPARVKVAKKPSSLSIKVNDEQKE